ncbi:histone deacetylase [Streptomyces sioyaensis]|uniref:Histone deacetylase n=2 Tax=Streptomyces sioyaensis TaxID=67364 RepID=A0A4Q1R5L6_9ACTN|nr:histone deacetylase [Streptomyces sioyaensis]
MHRERLTAYLAGGRPPGGLRACPGCRDPRDPLRTAPVLLPGLLYFATESQVWTGGRAFYDPGPARTADDAPRTELPSQGYLLTVGQFSDIVAQEMYREPGEDLDLTQALTHGRAQIGPGRYETLVCAGALDGYPVLTCTAPWRSDDIAVNAPSAAYLRHIGAGIVAAHGWSVHRTARYLAGCPGAAGHWRAGEIESLLTAAP